ncbi:hypothetical protein RIF29_17203 [Crotalaria pallida]|uniref:GDSL esterase/lipase n=1 Tax=Crotalaria pallida TaxID=3830 RepID=A0AAN9IKB0_CROPI
MDTGNNNNIFTLVKANHLPYGRDFPGHVLTGRFSNGKLIPDIIASYLNITDTVPPYLDRNLTNEQLLSGVCFASAGSGLDSLTTGITNAISMSNQIEQHFNDYVERLKGIVGENKAKQILGDALVAISAGSNDFIINFYDGHTRSYSFTITEYQNLMQDNLIAFVTRLYEIGCRKFAVSGLPPIGCIPFQIEFRHEVACVDGQNSDSKDYNQILAKKLLDLQTKLEGSRIVF